MLLPLKGKIQGMEIDVLIDTSLFIAHTRQNVSRLTQAIERYKFHTPAVSVVTKFEYELGEVRAGRLPKFGSDFSDYAIVALNDAIWRRALYVQEVSIKANVKMELADLLIASTAINGNVPLLTLNFNDFAHLQTSQYHLRLPKIP